MSVQTISNIIFDNKEKLTDGEYKTIMDNLMIFNRYTDDLETRLSREFMEQFYYHSNTNNKLFNYFLWNGGISINSKISHIGYIKYPSDTILYKKCFNKTTKQYVEVKAKIEKIMPKYTYILFDNTRRKKISNITLCKIIFYPYICIE